MVQRGEKTSLTCEQCGGQWKEWVSQLRITGKGRFCSSPCKHKWRTQQAHEQRICKACGERFIVGGRGHGLKNKFLCSNNCQQSARYRRGRPCRELHMNDAAYIAGLVDGEGSVMLTERKAGTVHLRVAVSNTFKPVLEWLGEITGIGSVYRHEPNKSNHKVGWSWRCHSNGAEELLRQIRPFLRIKPFQADLAINFHERLRNPEFKADRSWQAEWMSTMKRMNKRGPLTDLTIE